MKAIVYRNADGGTSVCRPALGARLVAAFTFEGRHILPSPMRFEELTRQFKTGDLSPEWAESEDEFTARVAATDVPANATDVRIIDDAKVPQDRAFRDALKPDLTFDMDKAREIHREMLRRARGPMLAALDVDYMRASEDSDGEKMKEIAKRKQALRDVTKHKAIDAAKGTEDLKRLTVETLTSA